MFLFVLWRKENVLLAPTGFNFGIDDNPSKIPPNFGVSLCAEFVGGDGRNGAFELLLILLLLFEFDTLPDNAGPLLSTVTVGFNFVPFWILCSNADLESPDDFPAGNQYMHINIFFFCSHEKKNQFY